MLIQNVHKGRTEKVVSMLDTNNYSDEEILAKAMEAARETRATLFGWHITRYPEQSAATVRLYTD